jgi:3-oxoacyl-[acyl-carrier-protein] synthase II
MSSGTNGRRRVVITGLGMITPVGNDVATSWERLLAGTSGASTITRFEATEAFTTRIACEVKDFDPSPVLDRKEARRYDRFAQFAGSGIGGIATFEEQSRTLIERGPGRVSPFFVPMFIPDIAAGLISIRYGAMGANFATVSACSSSAHAIGEAARTIERGDTDRMIAGGAEATITPLTIAGFSSMKAMSTRNDDPAAASRPFDAGRDGFVIGEGAGALILESLEHAQDRGAAILGEIAGYGLSADAYHITSPHPEGKGAQHAMRMALDDAGAAPQDVDYINAHGTSTPQNDARETAAIRSVFGDSAETLVVGSTKSMTGHLLGAAGAVEAVVATLACRDGKIPPTINFSEADPDCDLDYAHHGMVERPVRLALSNSFGFGGHNVCLAVRRWEA